MLYCASTVDAGAASVSAVAGVVEILPDAVFVATLDVGGELWVRIVYVDEFDAGFDAAEEIVGTASGVNGAKLVFLEPH